MPKSIMTTDEIIEKRPTKSIINKVTKVRAMSKSIINKVYQRVLLHARRKRQRDVFNPYFD